VSQEIVKTCNEFPSQLNSAA